MPLEITEIRPLTEKDIDVVVDFSLRAWEPVFASLRTVLGEELLLRLHPDWRADQAAEVRSICANLEHDADSSRDPARDERLRGSDALRQRKRQLRDRLTIRP
jgi:hypothetical protein